MTRANIALALAIIACVAIAIHVFVPTPPAHTMDPFGLGRRPEMPPAT